MLNDEQRSLPIDLVPLSVRTRNCLYYLAEVRTLGAASDLSDEELLEVPNFGKRSLAELRKAVEDIAQGKTPDPRCGNSSAEAKSRRNLALALRKGGATLKQIGAELGVSAGRTRQLIERAEREVQAEQAWAEVFTPAH